jgi:glycosyltransferase involved in cell wall biosynthesis
MLEMPCPNPVAIIIPCYNGEEFLPTCIESALAQNCAEVIIIDDGSTDNSLEIARRFEPQVRVFTGPNQGVSAARNIGIQQSSAEWLLFLDADDYLASGSVARRLMHPECDIADVIVCDWREVGQGARSLGPQSLNWAEFQRDPELAIARGAWATTGAIIYRRTLVARIGGFRRDLPIIQDARFFLDAARHKAKFAHAFHVGANYRIVDGSLSRKSRAQFSLDLLRNGQQIQQNWADRGMLDASHAQTLRGLYDLSARGLLATGDPAFHEAVAAMRELGPPISRYASVAGALAGLFGLQGARRVMAILGRT